MAEVNGGIGVDAPKFNGIQSSDEKDPTNICIKVEEIEDDDEEEEENTADQEDSSPSDYECSLREENIRLKSRLEQAKEGMSTMEKQCKKAKDELEKEKKFGDKANSTIYALMQEKQALIEKLKVSQPPDSSVHTEGIQEVVRKLEHEIQVLEERLDNQRKRYHQEHLVMYEDLKEERMKRQEWKQTYLKSQLAVMTFRRKLFSMKDRVSEDDIKELSKCLELVFHEPDGRIKQDLISKTEEACVEGNSKYAALINSTYKPATEGQRLNEQQEMNQIPEKMSEVKDQPTAAGMPQNQSQSQGPSLKHTSAEEEGNEGSTPKVFIMDEDNELHDPSIMAEDSVKSKDYVSVKSPTTLSTSTSHSQLHNSSLRYELTGNKHHNHSMPPSSRQPHQTLDSSPQYKHWHHYSIDNPGHNPGRKLEGLSATRTELLDNVENKKSLVHTLQRLEDASYKSKFSKYNHGYNDQLELNVNDTKFLELNFDRNFMKSDFADGVPSKLPKLLQQKNGIRTEVVNKKFDEKKLYCLTCDKDVLNHSCGHTTIIVQEKEREFPCPTCARVFTNRSHLKRHNMIHSGEKPFACTYCDKRFNRKSHLSRHLLTHTGEKPFKCPTCDKGFADNSDLKRHKQIHEASSNLVPILPKDQMNSVAPVNSVTQIISSLNNTQIISSLNNITNVVPTVSSPQPTTSIPISNIPISNVPISSIPLSVPLNIPKIAIAPSLVRPLGSALKKELRYACNKCGKNFSRKSHLTRHKLTHEQVKIYCDCGRLFRQNAHFQAHYPACKRKRDEIEAKYLAIDDPSRQGEHQTNPVSTVPNTDVSSGESFLQVSSPVSSVDSSSSISSSISNIKSVNDFRAHLAAKFNEGASFIDTTPTETVVTNQSANEKQIKIEEIEHYNEAQQRIEDHHQDTSSTGDNVLNEHSFGNAPSDMAPPQALHQTVQYPNDVHGDTNQQAEELQPPEQDLDFGNPAVKICSEEEVEEGAHEEEHNPPVTENSVESDQRFIKTPVEVKPTNDVHLAVQYSTSANINQLVAQKGGEVIPTQLRGGNQQQLYLVSRDLLTNQYLQQNNTNIEQKFSSYKLKEEVKAVVNEQNDEKISIQKMSDINFNIIVKNGSSELPPDDLDTLGSTTTPTSLPSLPTEVPPLLNE